MDEQTMRRYREATDWLLRLNARDPSESDIAAWLRWCETDADNLRAFERMQADWLDVTALRKDETFRIPSAWQTPRPILFARYMSITAVAAALILVTLAAFFWGPLRGAFIRNEVVAQTGNVTTALPDGSLLILRAQSKIKLAFTANERDLDLSEGGEAYFKVRHDTARPFVVHAGLLRVEAVGTEFDVSRLAERTRVVVEEGRVRIVSASGEQWFAGAGERFELDTSLGGRAGGALLARVNPARALGWREGEFAYDRVALKAVLHDVNQYIPRKIVVRDPRVANMPYTGTVFIRSVNDWLQALASRYPVRAVPLPNGETLLESTGSN